MPNRKALYLILLTLAIIAAVLAGIIWYQQKQELKVVFLDVGQGDAILISQGSNQILIDGGPDGKKAMEKLGEYVPFWDRQIEIVIATHPDQDHIDGLVDVMSNYNIGEVIDNGVEADTQIYKKYKDVIATKSINQIEGKAGMEIKMADDTKLEILSPDGTQDKSNPKDTNVTNIVSKLTSSGKSILFMGDFTTAGESVALAKMEDSIEASIEASKNSGEFLKSSVPTVAGISASSGNNWHADILKIGHHGSKYSTSEEFLNAVKPEEAVISVGKNNRYGHPAEDVINRLNSHRIKIMRTDEVGDVEYDF